VTAAVQPDWGTHIDLHDMVDELTRPHTSRQHYTAQVGSTAWSRHHVHHQPSLLGQLEHAAPSGQGEERAAGGYESRPAARLEAVDTFMLIDHQAARWVRQLGEDDPGDTATCVRLTAALIANVDRCHRHKPHRDDDRHITCCTWHRAEDDVRRWWTLARIAAGWEDAPWRPHATCPACGHLGGLRVRMDQTRGSVGMCVECHETWPPETIGILGQHITNEAFRLAAGRRIEPCWCPWPTPVDRIGELCRTCASGRCHRAITATLARRARQAMPAGRPVDS